MRGVLHHPRRRGVDIMLVIWQGLFVVDDVLSSSQCQAICDAARELVLPTNPRNLPPPKGEAFRNNERLLINDETFATVRTIGTFRVAGGR